MKLQKQEELLCSFLDNLDDDVNPLYQEIITCLVDLGYSTAKVRSNIAFKHELHNKQIAKIGIKKNSSQTPFFALRFSACKNYSSKFSEIVSAYIKKYPTRTSRCTSGECNFCAGEPETHVYRCTLPDGEVLMHCGAYTVEISDITEKDIVEIKSLINEEDKYLQKYEARAVT